MAHDSSTPSPSRLSDDTIAALREALGQYLSNGMSPETIQDVLLRMAAEAREKQILPEQLLITLKEVWGGLPQVRAMSNNAEQVRLLQRVVTMCIKEYYS